MVKTIMDTNGLTVCRCDAAAWNSFMAAIGRAEPLFECS